MNSNELLFSGRGSTALWAILKALPSETNKILVPANICEIIIPIIRNAGMMPVYYDVDPVQGNADLSHIQKAFTGNEQVLLAVHNFGTPLPIQQIAAWARSKNLFLVEDVCNALGATYNGIPLGSFGDAAIFSFGYAKIIEKKTGGALVMKDPKLRSEASNILNALPLHCSEHEHFDDRFQAKLKEIRQDGQKYSPEFYVPLYEGYVDHLLYRVDQQLITEIHKDLKALQKNIKRRNEIAQRYRTRISNPLIQHKTPVNGEIFWRYCILAANSEMRNALVQELRKNGILVSSWYPPVNHLFDNSMGEQEMIGAYSFSQRVLNLFVDKRVSNENADQAIEIINEFQW